MGWRLSAGKGILYSAIPLLSAAKQGPSIARASVSPSSLLPSPRCAGAFSWHSEGWDDILRSAQGVTRVGEPQGLWQPVAEAEPWWGFVHGLFLCVTSTLFFPQVMLPWGGCRTSLCPTPTSASTSGRKMTSSVSGASGLDQGSCGKRGEGDKWGTSVRYPQST